MMLFRPATEMQNAIAKRLGRGLTYVQAAKEIGISPDTVRCHANALAAKIKNPSNIPPKTLVTLWARESGLVSV